ncbi:conserved hypothetical protein [Magnetococcus marinus MC-1]|uniref:Phage-Barnase-EndoU-ColicinE5/D-RelE like nuclease 3 domain-containing protein n=1 Tax=Magnetococcus marinus (strain ATCC BAA-1437 / JCM 17883 / MC-1) TaxID=156889 RepID=A0L978_MAGMM|nr:hypothetical protein [Magnetococcus marinus]ABK44521.1 conserved hypothetical protein [Magnetococcus marinus MC-1]
MAYPALLQLNDLDAYRQHFEATYCQGPIATFDGIAVRFRKSDFDHCCFESSRRNKIKDSFSPKRAERLDWIKTALQDPDSDRFIGWDGKRKRYDNNRRVTLVVSNYVVVIALTSRKTARFITAYVADTPRSLEKIKASPKWT